MCKISNNFNHKKHTDAHTCTYSNKTLQNLKLITTNTADVSYRISINVLLNTYIKYNIHVHIFQDIRINNTSIGLVLLEQTRFMSIFLRLAQDPVAKLVIDPEVDEEVGEVVDVDYEVEVAPDWQIRVVGEHSGRKRRERENQQHHSDLDRLHVTSRFRSQPVRAHIFLKSR